jgi:hypothetical protein
MLVTYADPVWSDIVRSPHGSRVVGTPDLSICNLNESNKFVSLESIDKVLRESDQNPNYYNGRWQPLRIMLLCIVQL